MGVMGHHLCPLAHQLSGRVGEGVVIADDGGQGAKGCLIRGIGALCNEGFAGEGDGMVLAINAQELPIGRDEGGLVAHAGHKAQPPAQVAFLW